MQRYFMTCLCLVTILLSACDSPLEYDIGVGEKDYDVQTVLNAAISATDPVKVHLSRSRAILDGSPISAIENAVVELYADGHTITLSGEGNGYFRSNESPVAGKTYQISASTPYGIVSASQYVPHALAFDRLYFEDSVRYESADVVLSKVVFEITDHKDEQNFYDFVLYQRSHKDTIYPLDYRLDPLDPSELQEDILNGNRDLLQDNGTEYIDRSLFSDELFNGQSIRMSLLVKVEYPNQPIYLHLKSITKDYFDYILQVRTSNQTLDDPFTEPVTVQTNIEGGLGIFGGYSLALDSLNG